MSEHTAIEWADSLNGRRQDRGAVISDCGKFRYVLWRVFDRSLPALVFIMLNPSTADADVDDPTIRKCIGFAQRLGFGAIRVVNLFAWRATDPRDLRLHGYQVGPCNDEIIDLTLDGDSTVVCAWGSHARGLSRPAAVLRIVKRHNLTPHALQINAGGIPAHPLMLPYSSALRPFHHA